MTSTNSWAKLNTICSAGHAHATVAVHMQQEFRSLMLQAPRFAYSMLRPLVLAVGLTYTAFSCLAKAAAQQQASAPRLRIRYRIFLSISWLRKCANASVFGIWCSLMDAPASINFCANDAGCCKSVVAARSGFLTTQHEESVIGALCHSSSAGSLRYATGLLCE